MVRGVVCATRGNHGQSLAFAGRAAGVPVTIVVPHGNSPDKNAAMRGFGAELIEHGVDFQAALEHSAVLAEERGLEAVPSFHRDLCRGVATYAHELFNAAGRARRRLRAGRTGVGHLRSHHDSRSAGPRHGDRRRRVGACPGDGTVVRRRCTGQHRHVDDIHRRRRDASSGSGGDRDHRRRRGPNRADQRGSVRRRGAADDALHAPPGRAFRRRCARRADRRPAGPRPTSPAVVSARSSAGGNMDASILSEILAGRTPSP